MGKSKKPNQKPLIFVADSEAQTAFNDSKLSDEIELGLKKRANEIKHEILYHPTLQLKVELRNLEKEVAAKSVGLCNEMNTYLLGYSEIKNGKRAAKWYESRVSKMGVEKAQDEWAEKNVNYYYKPEPTDEPWQAMLNDMVKKYRDKIDDGKRWYAVIYFHNLDYDAQNLLQHIVDQDFEEPFSDVSVLHNGSLYSLSFMYAGCHFELRDSMKIYNQSLAKLGANVGWPKKTEDATYRWIDLDSEVDVVQHELYYFKHDIAVLAAIMRSHVEKFPGKLRLTAAGYAEADLKATVKEDDERNNTRHYNALFEAKYSDAQEKYLRHAYFGGFVYANYKYVNKKMSQGLVGDVNSLYPSVMLNRNYPKWDSITKLTETEFKQLGLHDYNTFAVVTIKIKKLRLQKDGVPCFPKKSAFGMSREIMSDHDLADDTAILTNFDLYWIMQNYEMEYEYVTGVIARRAINHPFTSFILKHKAEKELAVQAGNKVDKMIAKIHLNSTYGKFAQRKITTKTVLTRNNNGTIGFTEEIDPSANPVDHNILIAVFITAFARDVLLSMIEILKHESKATFWYCDTDSVHFGYNGALDIVKDDEKIFQELNIPFDKSIFGKWKPEQHMMQARYLGSKRYWEEDPALGEAIIKGAGIQKAGKAYLSKQGIDAFQYRKDKALIVPFTVSKKVRNGVKIYNSTKLIEPTPAQRQMIKIL
jgi:hypothetical protein